MKIGQAGLKLIQEFEQCKLTAYQDGAGVWTIGWGHTAKAGPPAPVKGMTITQARADEIFAADLAVFEKELSGYLKRIPNQNQFDAMMALIYNIGGAGFAGSSVLRYFNNGEFAKAATSFLLWNKQKNKKTKKLEVVRGLTRRRTMEMSLFLRPVEQAVPVMSPPGAVPAQSKGTNMTGEMVWGIIRTILASVAGYFAGKGYFDSETATAVIGAIGTIFIAGWSIFSKAKA